MPKREVHSFLHELVLWHFSKNRSKHLRFSTTLYAKGWKQFVNFLSFTEGLLSHHIQSKVKTVPEGQTLYDRNSIAPILILP